jgi:hypothetical protein
VGSLIGYRPDGEANTNKRLNKRLDQSNRKFANVRMLQIKVLRMVSFRLQRRFLKTAKQPVQSLLHFCSQ